MDQEQLEKRLAHLPLGGIRFFETLGSTNDEAAAWADQGAADFSLVVADEQTQGRGRGQKKWFTPPGSALAFSLVLRPEPDEPREEAARLAGLGALAVCGALADLYGLAPEIKWPNDVLLEERKVCGVLPEAHWKGDRLLALILGIGINVAPPSVPPAESLDFPATSVEGVLGKPAERVELLAAALARVLNWRPRLYSQELISAWQAHLAFKTAWVRALSGAGKRLEGQILGLDERGRLRIRLRSGAETALQAGEIHLRPLVDRT